MATGVASWSLTAANNATADSAVNWAEGQAPSTVNDSARAMMASVAKYRDDIAGGIVTGGTGTAYTATTNQVFGSLALLDGRHLRIYFSDANGSNATLAVDGLAAKPIYINATDAVSAGVIDAGSYHDVVYSNSLGAFVLTGASGHVNPTGTVLPYAGSAAPSGYLLCYGQAVSRTTYAALFGVLSTTYGAGNGSTTFNLPDLRGRAVAGKDDMGGSAASRLTATYFGTSAAALGAAGGSESHTLTAAESAALTYTSTVTDPGHTHSFSYSPQYSGSASGGVTATGGATTTSSSVTGITVATTSNAGGGAHANVPPTLVLNFIIKT